MHFDFITDVSDEKSLVHSTQRYINTHCKYIMYVPSHSGVEQMPQVHKNQKIPFIYSEYFFIGYPKYFTYISSFRTIFDLTATSL